MKSVDENDNATYRFTTKFLIRKLVDGIQNQNQRMFSSGGRSNKINEILCQLILQGSKLGFIHLLGVKGANLVKQRDSKHSKGR